MNYIKQIIRELGDTQLLVGCPLCQRSILMGEDMVVCPLCWGEIEQLNIRAWAEYYQIQEINNDFRDGYISL